jgi:CBS domain containing-hemolysin-like protein
MLLLVLLVLLTLAGSFFCSLSEAAILASSEARIRVRVEQGSRAAERLLAIKRSPGRTLASIVFLNNAFNIGGSAVVSVVGTEVLEGAGAFSALVVSLTLLIIMFGEIVPKVLGDAHPEAIAAAIAPALVWVRRVMTPGVLLVEVLTRWARPRSRAAKGEEEEIRELARLGHEGGHIGGVEAELIHRIFRMDDITATDVMTPRGLVRGFRARDTLESARDRLLSSGHSQHPVFEEDLDQVVGILWIRDALAALARGEGARAIREVMRPALFLPGSRTIDEVLRDLQASQRKMAIVIDEYGITQGILTMDDLVEELLGEAIDETDVREGLVKRVSRTTALVHGLTRVYDVARFLNCTVATVDDEEGTATVTGLLAERLGRVPRAGDRIEVPPDLALEVKEADERMAIRILARNTRGHQDLSSSQAAPRPAASG